MLLTQTIQRAAEFGLGLRQGGLPHPMLLRALDDHPQFYHWIGVSPELNPGSSLLL